VCGTASLTDSERLSPADSETASLRCHPDATGAFVRRPASLAATGASGLESQAASRRSLAATAARLSLKLKGPIVRAGGPRVTDSKLTQVSEFQVWGTPSV
jgi:hypothetical protein